MQTYTIPQGTKELTIETYNDKIVIEFVPEKKKPIFITEDGVALYNPDDKCWYVRLRDNGIGEQPFVHKEMADHVNFKYFSTRKAAEEYVAKKNWRPEDGDIISTKWWIEIFKCGEIDSYKYYASCRLDGSCLSVCGGLATEQEDVKPATAAERQLLFYKLAEAGYRWNAEEKKIEKLRWRAKHGESYWTFDGKSSFETFDIRFAEDTKRYENGFYFQTEEQAEKARMETIKLLLTTEF